MALPLPSFPQAATDPKEMVGSPCPGQQGAEPPLSSASYRCNLVYTLLFIEHQNCSECKSVEQMSHRANDEHRAHRLGLQLHLSFILGCFSVHLGISSQPFSFPLPQHS